MIKLYKLLSRRFRRNAPITFSVLPLPTAAFVVISFLLLFSCAQMGELSGGERDSILPEMDSSKTYPANQSVNFTSDKIEINFKEYIQVAPQQVVITPAMTKKPTVKAKGKKLEIQFNEELKPNTTYTVNLSGAVTDITENNVVNNLQYVFSTGPFLDSLHISGRVVNAFSQQGVNATTVILHATESDTFILGQKPSYFLKTSRDGSFRFSNLKQGKYRLYALNDKNADFIYNGYPEEIAFLDTVITLDTAITGLKLFQFKPTDPKLRLRATTHVSKWVQSFTFNKSINGLSVKAIRNMNADSLRLIQRSDSVFYLQVTDTLITDTAFIQIASRDSVIDTVAFTAHLNKKMSAKTSFKLTAPAEFYITDSIFIASNMQTGFEKELISLTDTLHKKPVGFKINTSILGITIKPDIQTEKVPLKLVALPGAFYSLSNKKYKSDSLVSVFTFYPVEKMGSIELKLEGLSDSLFTNPVCVLLMEGKPLMRKNIKGKTTLNFESLKPGNYSFFIFNDRDGNNQWSPGNFNDKTQSEEIIWYTQPVKVKANWQQELTWVML